MKTNHSGFPESLLRECHQFDRSLLTRHWRESARVGQRDLGVIRYRLSAAPQSTSVLTPSQTSTGPTSMGCPRFRSTAFAPAWSACVRVGFSRPVVCRLYSPLNATAGSNLAALRAGT
jgi:hypothetical protein